MRARAPARVSVLVPLLLSLLQTAAFAAPVAHTPQAVRPAPAVRAAASDPACDEDAFKKNGSVWGTTFRWYFAVATTPAGMTRLGAERALKRAVANITGSQNDCGLTDQVSARAAYQGRTAKKPNITTSSTCGNPDGKSVIGFGQLSATDLGLTCYWTKDNKTVEADIKLNKSTFQWFVKKPSACVAKFSVEAVATHELGHAFGLDHVSEATDGHLTMSPLISPCQSSEKSLGLGDVKGLRSLY